MAGSAQALLVGGGALAIAGALVWRIIVRHLEASRLARQLSADPAAVDRARGGNALIDLGSTAAKSQGPLVATIPLANQLDRLGTQLEPTATQLDKLTASLEQTGAIGQLMAVLFYGATAGNGFDSLGHYVRDEVYVSSCTAYATTPVPGCSARFPHGAATAADTTAAAPTAADQTAATTAAVPPAARADVTKAAAAAGASMARNGSVALQRLLDYLIGSGR